jgi:hypothetical protein
MGREGGGRAGQNGRATKDGTDTYCPPLPPSGRQTARWHKHDMEQCVKL